MTTLSLDLGTPVMIEGETYYLIAVMKFIDVDTTADELKLTFVKAVPLEIS